VSGRRRTDEPKVANRRSIWADRYIAKVFATTARNLPEHSTNAIHTDIGAVAAGFPQALVAGVTSYAYAVHPIVDHFGMAWVSSGSATVELRSPVFDGDLVTYDTEVDEATLRLTAQARERALAFFTASTTATSPWVPADVAARPDDLVGHPVLRPREVMLDGEFGSDYATRAGDDLTMFSDTATVHPAVWPALANRVFHEQLVRGPWVHTGSLIRHHRRVDVGVVATVDAVVARHWQRGRNRWATAVLTISVGDEVVASLLHTAIIEISDGEQQVHSPAPC
jgi:hypothetical protein